MTQVEVVHAVAVMNITHQRVVAALRDMEVLLAEAILYCQDEKALAQMWDVYELTGQLTLIGRRKDESDVLGTGGSPSGDGGSGPVGGGDGDDLAAQDPSG
jgi:hypothetical protein